MPEEGIIKSQPPKPPAIHTMQDDLMQSKTQPASLSVKENLPPVKTPRTSSNERNLSLPFPKTAASTPSSLSRIITIFVIIFAISAIIAGISLFVFSLLSRSSSNNQAVTAPPAVPPQASLILHYDLVHPASRKDIKNIWDQTTSTPTLTTLLSGDPRLLMTSEDISNIYYVMLPNITQPFLVVPQTDYTHDVLFGHTVPISVSEMDNWYVAHATDADQYTGALITNNSDAINLPFSDQEQSEPTSPITIILKQDILGQIRRDIAGEGISKPDELLTISANIGEDNVIRIDSTLKTPPDTPGGSANQQQLSFLPDDITSAYLGNNFKEDFEQQLGFKTTQRSLPAISSLIKQLTEPYAYYQRPKKDGQADFGLIITIPLSMQDELTLGNAVFEELLPYFLTLAFETTLTSTLVFEQTVYQNIPLRYSNVPGSVHALDYAIIDNYIIVATSQEGMEKVIRTFQGANEPILTSASITSLFNSWGLLPATNSLIVGRLLNQDILSILPVQPGVENVSFGVTISQSAIDNTSMLQGIIHMDAKE